MASGSTPRRGKPEAAGCPGSCLKASVPDQHTSSSFKVPSLFQHFISRLKKLRLMGILFCFQKLYLHDLQGIVLLCVVWFPFFYCESCNYFSSYSKDDFCLTHDAFVLVLLSDFLLKILLFQPFVLLCLHRFFLF